MLTQAKPPSRRILLRLRKDVSLADVVSFAVIIITGVVSIVYSYYQIKTSLEAKTDQSYTLSLERQMDALNQALRFMAEKQDLKAEEDRLQFAQLHEAMSRLEKKLDQNHR